MILYIFRVNSPARFRCLFNHRTSKHNSGTVADCNCFWLILNCLIIRKWFGWRHYRYKSLLIHCLFCYSILRRKQYSRRWLANWYRFLIGRADNMVIATPRVKLAKCTDFTLSSSLFLVLNFFFCSANALPSIVQSFSNERPRDASFRAGYQAVQRWFSIIAWQYMYRMNI